LYLAEQMRGHDNGSSAVSQAREQRSDLDDAGRVESIRRLVRVSMTSAEAASAGLTPCRICNPDTVAS